MASECVDGTGLQGMIESTESPDDVEEALTKARKALRSFEDGVDSRRLLLRLRTSSPAHPVLLARFLFAVLTFLCLVAAVAVMVITVLVDNDIARTLAKFEQVMPVPEGIPALPAMLGLLALCMFFAWLMATLAALAIGRDATMLPWEQKQHQKLVNEVTRLTTQKAVMERIRATPAGARPRIATPVPVSMRDQRPSGSVLGRSFGRSPAPAGRSGRSGRSEDAPAYASPAGTGAGGFGPASGAFTRTSEPSGTAENRRSTYDTGPYMAARSASGGFGRSRANTLSGPRRPASQAPAAPPVSLPDPPSNSAPSARFASPASAPHTPHAAPPPAYAAPAYSAPSPVPPPAAASVSPPVNGAGTPRFAPTGASHTEDLELIIDDSEDHPTSVQVGGVRLGGAPVPMAQAQPQEQRQLSPQEHQVEDYSDLIELTPEPDDDPSGILGNARANRATPFGSAGRVRPAPRAAGDGLATRGGTPLGAAPKAGAGIGRQKPRLAPPLGFPGTPDRAGARSNVPSGIFGTPPPITRSKAPSPSYRTAGELQQLEVDEAFVMEDAEEDAPTTAGTPIDPSLRGMPTFRPIPDAWLRVALSKAEALIRSFPIQAYLEFSQEPNLPFTLVIARATPAMAVRAMVNYVEFMASIYTPPRGRIELVNVAHLDRSFHMNVQAALEPYFGENVEVEPNPGRVDIRFTDPDPGWGSWPMLPVDSKDGKGST